MACGLKVWGVDASPSMVAAFRERFPDSQVQCAAVEDADFFGRTFDGAVAWGLMFLLQPETQRSLIAKVATHLVPGGKFLFTAPRQIGSWNDVLTGEVSVSLGREAYCEALEAAGLVLVGNVTDDGENYYYFAERR
jgi:SAM-dependent methyltransferase